MRSAAAWMASRVLRKPIHHEGTEGTEDSRKGGLQLPEFQFSQEIRLITTNRHVKIRVVKLENLTTNFRTCKRNLCSFSGCSPWPPCLRGDTLFTESACLRACARSR